ncbi:MAG TPA: hypothetical protein VMJ10_15570 [Kofleriaceae bacterium]|nr:hypothetical protein [Kofleriaceae bacterium]
MGWACTLHVVDESSLARFSARFLHGLHRDRAFDAEYDGDAMISDVKRLIAEDPETGGRALGELALLYVSTETPHVRCRDVALSLWDEQIGAPLPPRWLGTVETWLPNITAAYPKVVGHVPARFDEPRCVGVMVAARDVPPLLAHVEHALEGHPLRAKWQRLVDVLHVAAQRGCAYWEGNDIDVPQAHQDWLGAAALAIAPSPLTSPLARPLAIAGARMLVGEPFVLHEIDLATFPPAVITSPDMQVNAAAFTPWGTDFVRMANDRTQRPLKFAYYELPGREPIALEPPYPIGLARPGKDCVLVFPQPRAGSDERVRPMIMRPGLPLEPLDVPEAVPAPCDAIAFGDGALLVIWNNVPYRWDGEGAPVSLGGELAPPEDLCGATTLADGAIVGAFGRRLVRIDRDGKREELLALDNVIAVARGPDDALIVGESESRENDVLKIWWPRARELACIDARVFGLDDRPTFFYFDSTSERLVVARPGHWHALPWRELVELRRVGQDEVLANRRA